MAGETTVTPGKTFTSIEAITHTKLNLLGTPSVTLDDGAVTVDQRDTHLKPKNATSNHSLGQVNQGSAVTAAGGELLTLGTDEQVQRFNLDAGSGAYTYNIDFDKSGAWEGAAWWVFLDKEASINPTITFRDGSAGSTIASYNGVTKEERYLVFVYDGTNWKETMDALESSSSGHEYGSIYVSEGSTNIVLATQNAWQQVTQFAANGQANVIVPDHTEDHLTISGAGVYEVSFSCSFSGTGSDTYEVGVFTNNGGTEFEELGVQRKLGTGGDVGDTGSATVAVNLGAGDTLELWARAIDGDTKNFTVSHAALTCFKIADL